MFYKFSQHSKQANPTTSYLLDNRKIVNRHASKCKNTTNGFYQSFNYCPNSSLIIFDNLKMEQCSFLYTKFLINSEKREKSQEILSLDVCMSVNQGRSCQNDLTKNLMHCYIKYVITEICMELLLAKCW